MNDGSTEAGAGYRRDVAATIATACAPLHLLGPNVVESEEHRLELIESLLRSGINPRRHRIVAVMEDYAGAPNYKGSARFTELYLEGFAALGFTVVQVVPPRRPDENLGVGERNGVEQLKSGIFRVRHLPSTVEDRTGRRPSFQREVAATLAKLSKGTLLRSLYADDAQALRDFAGIEGRPSLVIIEDAYRLFPDVNATLDRMAKDGTTSTHFVYHPDKENSERSSEMRSDGIPLRLDGTDEVSPLEALMARVGRGATFATISSGSAAAFEDMKVSLIDRVGRPAHLPPVVVKPAGMPTAFPAPVETEAAKGTARMAWLGRMTSVKGPDVAIEALRALRELNPDLGAQLVMMGTGPMESSLRRDNRDLVEADALVFLGEVDELTKSETLASSDVLLVTSGVQQESWHMASGEARQQRCLPVAMGSIGGVSDGQRKGGGAEADTRDVAKYAAFIDALLTGDASAATEAGLALRVVNGDRAVMRASEAGSVEATDNQAALDAYRGLPTDRRFGRAETPWAEGAVALIGLTGLRPSRQAELTNSSELSL